MDVGHFCKVGHWRVKLGHISFVLWRFSITNLTWAWGWGGRSILTHPVLAANKGLALACFCDSLSLPWMWVLIQLGVGVLMQCCCGRRGWRPPAFFLWYYQLYWKGERLRSVLKQTAFLINMNSGLHPLRRANFHAADLEHISVAGNGVRKLFSLKYSWEVKVPIVHNRKLLKPLKFILKNKRSSLLEGVNYMP